MAFLVAKRPFACSGTISRKNRLSHALVYSRQVPGELAHVSSGSISQRGCKKWAGNPFGGDMSHGDGDGDEKVEAQNRFARIVFAPPLLSHWAAAELT